MRQLKVLVFLGFCAAMIGCGDTKTAPPSLKQDMPKSKPSGDGDGGGDGKGMTTNKAS